MYVDRLLDVARRRLVTVHERAPLTEAARLLDARHISVVIACDAKGLIAGVVSKTDVVRRIGYFSGGACTASVATAMTRDVVCCRTTEQLQDVWALMKGRDVAHVPLVDQHGRPLGVIHARDVLQELLSEVENEEELLRDYVLGIGYQ